LNGQILAGNDILEPESEFSYSHQKYSVVYRHSGSAGTSGTGRPTPPVPSTTGVDPPNFREVVIQVPAVGTHFRRSEVENALRKSGYVPDRAIAFLFGDQGPHPKASESSGFRGVARDHQEKIEKCMLKGMTLEMAVRIDRDFCAGNIQLAEQVIPEQGFFMECFQFGFEIEKRLMVLLAFNKEGPKQNVFHRQSQKSHRPIRKSCSTDG
jgi:hypothetical protein